MFVHWQDRSRVEGEADAGAVEGRVTGAELVRRLEEEWSRACTRDWMLRGEGTHQTLRQEKAEGMGAQDGETKVWW